MSEQLLVRLTKRIEQNYGNVLPIRRNTWKQGNKRFRQKIVFVRCKKNRQIITKEEGSKEEDRQGEADVKKIFFVKNGYADLKRLHQNDEIRKIFKWADHLKH